MTGRPGSVMFMGSRRAMILLSNWTEIESKCWFSPDNVLGAHRPSCFPTLPYTSISLTVPTQAFFPCWELLTHYLRDKISGSGCQNFIFWSGPGMGPISCVLLEIAANNSRGGTYDELLSTWRGLCNALWKGGTEENYPRKQSPVSTHRKIALFKTLARNCVSEKGMWC